jgi:NTP pyrophosphatase (non-canonical NTP hydrolase)
MSDTRGRIYFDVSMERDRQDTKWGDQSGNPPTVWAAVLAEECGEAAQAALHVQFEHRLTVADLRRELVQTAAVAVAWIEAIDEAFAGLTPPRCGHRKLADHELIPLLESCTYDIPISSGDVAVLSSRLAHSPIRMALAPEESDVARADPPSPLRAEGAPSEGARLG